MKYFVWVKNRKGTYDPQGWDIDRRQLNEGKVLEKSKEDAEPGNIVFFQTLTEEEQSFSLNKLSNKYPITREQYKFPEGEG